MSLVDWAFEVSATNLEEALPRRWAHVQGVARQARTFRSIVGRDAEQLEAAAILHDIGYAPALVSTGFHPLDGARYLEQVGFPLRVVRLVANHSCAQFEADERGLLAELQSYPAEAGIVADALVTSDLTVGPAGTVVDFDTRVAEIFERYSPDSPVYRALKRSQYELRAAVERTFARVGDHPT